MPLHVERQPEADSFLERAGPFLLEREAEHNLILGLAGRLRTNPRLYGDEPYFAVVLDGRRVLAAALRTPPHNLLLSEIDDEELVEPLADDAHSAFGKLPGVQGSSAAVARFEQLWHERTGATGTVTLRQRIYRASEAHVPTDFPGELCFYGDDDRPLIVEWMEAFVEEALPPTSPEDAEHWLERRLEEPDGGIVLWLDEGRPVAFASYGAPTPNGIRVGPVYTPPELRRRGYATALVGRMTHMLLEGGRRFCFLYTDLANPTSNSIYPRVGYEPVTDADLLTFS